MRSEVPIEQAAREMRTTVTDLKARMRLGIWHIGDYVVREGKGIGRYYIYRHLLNQEKAKYFGKGGEENKGMENSFDVGADRLDDPDDGCQGPCGEYRDHPAAEGSRNTCEAGTG